MNSVNTKFNGFEFCAALVDETSQIIEPETMLPLLKAINHFVLIGDNK